MADYIIIGGDKKEYGPVSTEDVRRWIAEGRLNAQSLAKGEGDAEFRQLSIFPELADAFMPKMAATPEVNIPSRLSMPAAARPAVLEPLPTDYELDITGSISRSWKLLKENFNLLFVGTLIYLLIKGVLAGLMQVPFTGLFVSIVNLIIVGPLMAGVFYIFIRALRKQAATAGDIFSGFRKNFGQLFLGQLVPALLIGLCLIPYFLIFGLKILLLCSELARTLASHGDPHEVLGEIGPVLLKSLPVLLVCLIPAIYLQISWMFTLPLIIDKEMDFWPAMKTSWRKVGKHWWSVFGLVLVINLVNLAGTLACCVGVLITFPIGLGALMYAYETIFSESVPPDA